MKTELNYKDMEHEILIPNDIAINIIENIDFYKECFSMNANEILKEIDKQRLALEDEVYKCDSIKVNYKINFLIGLLISKGSRFKSGNITIDFEKQTEENAEINPIVKHGEYIEITWCHQKYGGKKSEYFKVGAIFKVVWMRGCEETGRIICKLANPYKKGYLYMNSNNYNWKKYKNEN